MSNALLLANSQMSHDMLRIHFDQVVATLTAMAGDEGVVTTDQLTEVLGELDITEDLERLCVALEERGIFWCDPGDGLPPVFPADYAGLRVIKGGRE